MHKLSDLVPTERVFGLGPKALSCTVSLEGSQGVSHWQRQSSIESYGITVCLPEELLWRSLALTAFTASINPRNILLLSATRKEGDVSALRPTLQMQSSDDVAALTTNSMAARPLKVAWKDKPKPLQIVRVKNA